MTAPDVIQQAREALAHPGGFVYTPAEYGWWMALRAVVEAADAGHLIDARRIEAIRAWQSPISLVCGAEGVWSVTSCPHCLHDVTACAASAAEALAAAEREAA